MFQQTKHVSGTSWILLVMLALCFGLPAVEAEAAGVRHDCSLTAPRAFFHITCFMLVIQRVLK